jgi:hypothetical protein
MISCVPGQYRYYNNKGYHPLDYNGVGFTDIRIDETVFEVRYDAGTRYNYSKARDFALMRAAHLTLQYGFEYFTILQEIDLTEVNEYIIPGKMSTTRDEEVVDSTKTVVTVTTTHKQEQKRTAIYPECSMVIEMHSLKPRNSELIAHKAKYVYRSIYDSYAIELPPSRIDTLTLK